MLSLNAQTCQASFNSTNGQNGVVTFTSTSILTNSVGTVYYWSWGSGLPTFSATGQAGMFPSYQYTANGTYTVTLFIMSTAPSCSSAAQAVITITNSGSPCNLGASFTFSQIPIGQVQFNNQSINTTSNTTYTWTFGDGSSSNSVSPLHTYTNNGSYLVTLVASNNTTPSCTGTVQVMVNVNTFCNVLASFNQTIGVNGLVNFQSTSTGTLSGYIFRWFFGDGTQTNTGNGLASHTYSNGVYTPTLLVMNNSVTPTCTNSTSHTISVNTNTCFLSTPTISATQNNGVVSFQAIVNGTNANTTYTWTLGNGFMSNISAPTATYQSAGTYWVYLTVRNAQTCQTFSNKTLTITGIPCVANANFTVVPTATPQSWVAIPSSPWNITNAQWSWGDATSSYSLYASHQYSVAGMYPICLTVTANCGVTASACANYSIYKGSNAMIYINVQTPTLLNNPSDTIVVGLSDFETKGIGVYPQPNDGSFIILLNENNIESVNVSLYDITNKLVYSGNEILVSTTGLKPGMYVLSVVTRSRRYITKVIVE